ncbi:MAG: hypothetical protein HY525_12690 [Betaproteobacteria bacterium]|nr:hypothetical protein [Betaproteobacteria bacterium]
MTAPDQTQAEKTLFGLLVVALLISGVALMREGPYFDNVFDGWRFFSVTFLAGALAGYLGWTRAFGFTPMFKFSGANRHPWLAALALGLAAAAAASYVNRSFAYPAHRSFTAEIDSIKEGKGDRWHITVKMPDGQYQRYLVSQDVATALKNEQVVRLGVARGALGFDHIAGFEPLSR